MSNFKQYDTRWSKLPYPIKPHYIKDCGCGEVSIANVITETDEYKSATPKTILAYCKQFADPNGNGTYWNAIPTMLEHYGFTEVMEHETMGPLWKQLSKGNRVAVLLMDNTPAGTNKIHWTSQKHFICATAYKYENNKHWLFVKDSNSDSEDHNGWISYEDNLRNACFKVWSGKKPKKVKKYVPTTPYKGKLPNGVVKYGSKGTNVRRLKKFLIWCINAKLNPKSDKCADKTIGYVKQFQEQYKLEPDGIFGPESKKKAQEIIKAHEPTLAERVIEACKKQADYMKNYIYGWQPKPTIPKSKKKGTCVTFTACVLQRIGYLKSGECIWHTASGKVYGTNDKMSVTYPKNKTVNDLKSELKAGDVVITGDKKSVEAGGDSHIFIMSGKWAKDGNPYIYDNRSCDRVRNGKSALRKYDGSKKVIAVIKLKG